jgi:hypothetical protein
MMTGDLLKNIYGSIHTQFYIPIYLGFNVMIAIFSDFCRISAKKHNRFSYEPIFATLSSVLSQNAIFFVENIFKIITSAPCTTWFELFAHNVIFRRHVDRHVGCYDESDLGRKTIRL